MSESALHLFRTRVLADRRLVAALAALADPAEFRAACVALARDMGIALDPDDVEAAMRDHRRAWGKVNSA